MAKFSIIIPVYNVEKYLDACVESVLGQSFSDFEVLLIDDGATDRSDAMCDDWAAKDGRIRVIHQENQGLSGARNTGIREATGDYLMFLDSDDWWNGSQVLDAVARRLEKTQADVLSLNYQKVRDHSRENPYFSTAPLEEKPQAYDFSVMAEKELWIACAWNKVIRRRLFLENDLFFTIGIVSEDIDWSLRLALYAERYDYLADVSICYRQREGSLCHSSSAARVEGLCQNVERCLQLLSAAEEKVSLLQPYVAYQYATLLYNYAELPKTEGTKLIGTHIKSMSYLLSWSENHKVKLILGVQRMLGFRGMLLALRFRGWLLRGK